MNQATYPLAAGMINQFNRLDMISNNLANANTTGFKQESLSEGSFNHYLTRAQEEGFKPTAMNTLTNTVPKIDEKYISSEQGAIVITGNELDFALKTPDTFFKVQTPSGDIEYTRNGAFKNLNGFLVDANGNNVLSGDNEPIVVEDEYATLIGIVKTPYDNLEKVGNNNYQVKNLENLEFFEENVDHVVQGSIETSNVNMVLTMVGLIDAHRRMEQSQKAISGIGEMNQKMVQKLGDTR
jgi:flagellar basal-body rod protein FlgG